MRKARNNRFSERYPLLHRVTLPQSWKVDENEQRERTTRFNKVDALLREAEDLLPQAPMYLNSRQHDAQLISVERTAKDFTLWMEDFQVLCLSQTLEAMREDGIREKPPCYPVGLKFLDVYSLSVSRINNNDKILPLSVLKYLPRLDEFHYDEVTSIGPDLLSMGMLILTNPSRGPHIGALLVEVNCRKLEFIEGQRTPFEAIYGAQYPGLYDAFQSARRERRQYFDYSGARRFVLEEFCAPGKG